MGDYRSHWPARASTSNLEARVQESSQRSVLTSERACPSSGHTYRVQASDRDGRARACLVGWRSPLRGRASERFCSHEGASALVLHGLHLWAALPSVGSGTRSYVALLLTWLSRHERRAVHYGEMLPRSSSLSLYMEWPESSKPELSRPKVQWALAGRTRNGPESSLPTLSLCERRAFHCG